MSQTTPVHLHQQLVRHQQTNDKTTVIEGSKTVIRETQTILYESIANHVEMHLSMFWRNMRSDIQSIPQQRCKRVQSLAWLHSQYSSQRKLIKKSMSFDKGLDQLFQQSLLDIYKKHPTNFKHDDVLLHKFILRDHKQYQEYPTLLEISSVKRELKLPSHLKINQVAQQQHMYVLQPADLKLIHSSKIFMVETTFDLGQGVHVEQKLPLDLILSCAPYGEYTTEIYRYHVIEPLLQQLQRTYEKHYSRFYEIMSQDPTLQLTHDSSSSTQHRLRCCFPDLDMYR